jgi:hypothetical protein
MEIIMHIYHQEYLDGIATAIEKANSISYASLAEPCIDKALARHNLQNIKSLASLEDQDLYYLQSILVTSNWNKNDDIFDKQEIWAARNTPEDKPTNLEHDESLIIGHITSNWPINTDGQLISDSTTSEELPEKFHILTGSVIYRAFSKPELRERAEKLISEIENGQKYVSMECLFKGFDYGLLNKETGEYKILARNEQTAYLTKHLRAYGGRGEHQQYKIGRVLRNITFSGKGFVDKPANPESIIFTKNDIDDSEKKLILATSGVSNIDPKQEVENITMNLENEIVDIKSSIQTLTNTVASVDCNTAVREAYASVSAAETKIQELSETVKASEEALTQTRAEIEALRLEKEEAAKKMQKDMEDKEEEEKMMKAEKKMKRMAALIENGIESEVASATVDKFEHLDDDAFDTIAALIAAKKPPMKKEEEKMVEDDEAMMMKKKASTESTDPEVLETAEVEASVNLGVGGETEDAVETTRAALIDFVSSRLGKKL